jgi:secernin
LALERCQTAISAVHLIGNLLETYGQGGACFDSSANFNFGYDNSFLIVDGNEAWTMETCHRVWAAKRIHGRETKDNN